MRRRLQVFRWKISLIVGCLLFSCLCFFACKNEPQEKQSTRTPVDHIKRIPGNDDSLAPEMVKKGEVLISYSDCYTCHKKDQKLVGPAFIDIAKRYPANKGYIDLLALKVIYGSSRSWGYPVMSPHPKLSKEDATMMVTYILSLEK
jgi:cytochrome c